MTLSLEKFTEIIEKWKATNKKVDDCYKAGINVEFFDPFFALGETLMDEIFYNNYTETGVSYILYEWLYCDNKSPLYVIENNVNKEYTLNTIEDVYNTLEKEFKLK